MADKRRTDAVWRIRGTWSRWIPLSRVPCPLQEQSNIDQYMSILWLHWSGVDIRHTGIIGETPSREGSRTLHPQQEQILLGNTKYHRQHPSHTNLFF